MPQHDDVIGVGTALDPLQQVHRHMDAGQAEYEDQLVKARDAVAARRAQGVEGGCLLRKGEARHWASLRGSLRAIVSAVGPWPRCRRFAARWQRGSRARAMLLFKRPRRRNAGVRRAPRCKERAIYA